MVLALPNSLYFRFILCFDTLSLQLRPFIPGYLHRNGRYCAPQPWPGRAPCPHDAIAIQRYCRPSGTWQCRRCRQIYWLNLSVGLQLRSGSPRAAVGWYAKPSGWAANCARMVRPRSIFVGVSAGFDPVHVGVGVMHFRYRWNLVTGNSQAIAVHQGNDFV